MENAVKTPIEAEHELERVIRKYGLSDKLTVAQIKRWIRDSRGKAMEDVLLYEKKFLRYFRDEKKFDLQEVLNAFMDAWNAFPHAALGGISPNDMVKKAMKGRVVTEEDRNKKPDMIVGGSRMKWDDYWAMIREMERQQVPFKRWIEKEALPKFKHYLDSTAGKKKADELYEVADIFLNRVLHVGFLDLGSIRPDFIQKEFPRWWQTHVLDSELTEKQVRDSLRELYSFISVIYDIEPAQYGFPSIVRSVLLEKHGELSDRQKNK